MKIEVIQHRTGIDAEGREVSAFCSSATKIEFTGRWTWRVTDENGRTTYGMGRQPVATQAEANRVARSVPSGWTVVLADGQEVAA